MVLSSQTNRVYFSRLLSADYKPLYEKMTGVLHQHGIETGLLEGTKDYWCRDYMPIQVDREKFIQYTYDPDYLKTPEWKDYKTDPAKPLSHLSIQTEDMTDIVLDGGNVVKTPWHVIMTEKVIEANDHIDETVLRKRLEEAFRKDVIILPWWDRREDYCGHTDGMVRYIKDKELLIGDYQLFAPERSAELHRTLEGYGYIVHDLELPWHVADAWAYVNFLQTSKIILQPALHRKTDDSALRCIEELYDVPVVQIEAPYIIGKYGGAFNCMTWNILV